MALLNIITKKTHSTIATLVDLYLWDEWVVFRDKNATHLSAEQFLQESEWDMQTFIGIHNWLEWIEQHDNAKSFQEYAWVDWLRLQKLNFELQLHFHTNGGNQG